MDSVSLGAEGVPVSREKLARNFAHGLGCSKMCVAAGHAMSSSTSCRSCEVKHRGKPLPAAQLPSQRPGSGTDGPVTKNQKWL